MRGRACIGILRTQVDEKDRVDHGEFVVATVHGDDITIGGERSAVALLIKMMSRMYEIKKPVVSGDADREYWKNLESCHQVESRRHYDRCGSETCHGDAEGS